MRFPVGFGGAAAICLQTVTHHTDLELLKRYARQRAEDAFAELVRRHLDLVYSAALRQVRSPQLAEEVAQCAFVDLARKAANLEPRTVVAAWLYEVTRRSAVDVVRRESRRQQREQISIEMNALHNGDGTEWTHIEPLLDEAMSALDTTDRAAVLLRFFERKNLREVGAALGVSEDAAQKRVARALDRLREILAGHGVTTPGAAAFASVLSLHAVQSAPAGLVTTLAAGAAAGGMAVQSAQTIAMTLTQKTVVTAGFIAVAGVAIYQAQLGGRLRSENVQLRRAQAAATEQLEQLRQEMQAEAARRLSQGGTATPGNGRDDAELLRLRGEVARLRREGEEAAANLKQANADLIEAWSKVPPVKTLIATANETLGWDQALLAGGWKTPDGRRALVVVTVEPRSDGRQVLIIPRFLEYREEDAEALGVLAFQSDVGNRPDPSRAQRIGRDHAEQLIAAASSTVGVNVLSAPRVSTLSGNPAQVAAVQMKSLPNGETYTVGPTIDLVPNVSADGNSVQLMMTARINLRIPRPGESEGQPGKVAE